MKLCLTRGLPVAALVVFSGAIPAGLRADPLSEPPLSVAAAVVELATVSHAIIQLASAAQFVPPPVSPETTAQAADEFPPPQVTEPKQSIEPKRAAVRDVVVDGAALDELVGAEDTVRGQRRAAVSGKRLSRIALHAVGARQLGAAAWYGGRYIGRRTTSGSQLDRVHATAAHRTLPLNSLARVTNLANGRSVVVRITDRGPVSKELLIDMSPRAADQLDMRRAGIIRVAVEQVVELPADAQ